MIHNKTHVNEYKCIIPFLRFTVHILCKRILTALRTSSGRLHLDVKSVHPSLHPPDGAHFPHLDSDSECPRIPINKVPGDYTDLSPFHSCLPLP